MKKLAHLLFLLVIICSSSTASAIVIGHFPGWKKLIQEADAIVILRVDDAKSNSGIEPYYNASCYVLESLKGDLQPNTRVTLELIATSRIYFNIVATQLAFLRKKQNSNGEVGYSSLGFEGGLVELAPYGYPQKLIGDSIEDRIKKVLASAIAHFEQEHTNRVSWLNKLLTHESEVLNIQQMTPGSSVDVSLAETVSVTEDSEVSVVFNLTDTMMIAPVGATMAIKKGRLYAQALVGKTSDNTPRAMFRLTSIEYISAEGESRAVEVDGWVIGSDGLRGIPLKRTESNIVTIAAGTNGVAIFSKIKRSWLGIYTVPLTDKAAKELQLDNTKGVLVVAVLQDSPAASAGIMKDDIVVGLNRKQISSPEELAAMIEQISIGDVAEIGLLRSGKKHQLEVKIAQWQDTPILKEAEINMDRRELSKSIQNVSPELAANLGFDEIKGVVVSKVERRTLAEKIPLRNGDVILEIDSKKIGNVEDFESILDGAPKDRPLPMLILREGTNLFLVLP